MRQHVSIGQRSN